MAVRKLSQRSFVNGQYDRTAQNQESYSNPSVVSTGLSYAKNVLSSDKGELRKRLGTKYLKSLNGASVIVPFRMPDEDDAIFVFDSVTGKVKGYKFDNGVLIPLVSVGVNADVPFPDGNTWGNGVQGEKTVTNGNWTVSFTFPGRPSGFVQEYPGYLLNNNDGIYTTVFNSSQSVTIQNSVDSCCLRSVKFWFWFQDSTRYEYFTPTPIIEYSDDGINWVGVPTNFDIGDYTPISYTPPHTYHLPDGPTVTVPAVYTSKCSMTISQSQYGVNHNYWRVYFTDGKFNHVKMENLVFIDVAQTTEFEAVNPYTESQLKNIKYAQDNNELFIACEGVIPYRIFNNNNQITFSSFTPSNTSTLWQTMGGYPSSVVLFQGRLWFAGFGTYPQTVIASNFGDYQTFNANNPAQIDDYLNLRCNELKTAIRNMVAGQNVLYCFSEDGISMIDGGSSRMIATNIQNIQFHLKNRMPAGNSTPAFKDDVMLYSSSDGTKLYGVDFDLLVDRFQVDDLAKYAKDVTSAKITELHYLNNESKLVYGLTEQGTMFALLYEKGQYQGFFPLDFNSTVYDIAPFKVGRDYKLFMVTFRNGDWYLEEKLDLGKYIDTSNPRLTSEDKKWATYDNLMNNVALDCYQTYDESFSVSVTIDVENNVAVTTDDLSTYIGQSMMFGQYNDDSQLAIVDIIDYATVNKNMRKTKTNSTPYKYAYIDADTEENVPNIPVYDENGKYLTFGIWNGSLLLAYDNGVYEIYLPDGFEDMDIVTGYQITIDSIRSDSMTFDTAYPEFTVFQPNLPQTANVAVISEGRYFDAQNPDELANITLPVPCHKVIYGVVYEALAIIKLQTPYESFKNVAQVDLSVIDTTHLEVGTDFNDTQYLEKINDLSYYNLTDITMNDSYRIVVSDTPEMTKNVILRSDKGVPFTINAVEIFVNYSNEGGD